MAGRFHEATKRWHFDSVQDFWEAEGFEGQIGYVWKGRFEGEVQKGMAHPLREYTREALERGIEPDTLIVRRVQNHDRPSNHECEQPPPPRTGLFSAFMDEVEEVAHQAGCRLVWVKDVYNKFLRKKLEERGYREIPESADPNPDYAGVLPRK